MCTRYGGILCAFNGSTKNETMKCYDLIVADSARKFVPMFYISINVSEICAKRGIFIYDTGRILNPDVKVVLSANYVTSCLLLFFAILFFNPPLIAYTIFETRFLHNWSCLTLLITRSTEITFSWNFSFIKNSKTFGTQDCNKFLLHLVIIRNCHNCLAQKQRKSFSFLLETKKIHRNGLCAFS